MQVLQEKKKHKKEMMGRIVTFNKTLTGWALWLSERKYFRERTVSAWEGWAGEEEEGLGMSEEQQGVIMTGAEGRGGKDTQKMRSERKEVGDGA